MEGLYNEIKSLFDNAVTGTLIALLVYFLITRAIPWVWDKYSRTQQQRRDHEEEEKTGTRNSVKAMEKHLAELNGHTKNPQIHMCKDEMYKIFMTESSCGLKHNAIVNELKDVKKQNSQILEAILARGNGK